MAHRISFLWIVLVLLQNSVLAEDGEIRSSKNYQRFCYQQIDCGNQIRGAQAILLRTLFLLSLML